MISMQLKNAGICGYANIVMVQSIWNIWKKKIIFVNNVDIIWKRVVKFQGRFWVQKAYDARTQAYVSMPCRTLAHLCCIGAFFIHPPQVCPQAPFKTFFDVKILE